MRYDDMRHSGMRHSGMRYNGMRYGAFAKVFVDGKFLIKTKETNEVDSPEL